MSFGTASIPRLAALCLPAALCCAIAQHARQALERRTVPAAAHYARPTQRPLVELQPCPSRPASRVPLGSMPPLGAPPARALRRHHHLPDPSRPCPRLCHPQWYSQRHHRLHRLAVGAANTAAVRGPSPCKHLACSAEAGSYALGEGIRNHSPMHMSGNDYRDIHVRMQMRLRVEIMATKQLKMQTQTQANTQTNSK